MEYAAVNQLQSVLAKADALNQYQFFFGEPNSFQRDLDRYRRATVGDLKTWAQKVLTPDARLILRVLPELPAVTPDPRDQRPAIGSQGPFAPPLPAQFKLSNGIPVVFVPTQRIAAGRTARDRRLRIGGRWPGRRRPGFADGRDAG